MEPMMLMGARLVTPTLRLVLVLLPMVAFAGPDFTATLTTAPRLAQLAVLVPSRPLATQICVSLALLTLLRLLDLLSKLIASARPTITEMQGRAL